MTGFVLLTKTPYEDTRTRQNALSFSMQRLNTGKPAMQYAGLLCGRTLNLPQKAFCLLRYKAENPTMWNSVTVEFFSVGAGGMDGMWAVNECLPFLPGFTLNPWTYELGSCMRSLHTVTNYRRPELD
jgi:hypothetical protein